MRNILICGAYSGMAKEAARFFAKDGDALFLVGRDAEKLKVLCQDLKTRGAAAQSAFLAQDLNDLEKHDAILSQALKALGNLDAVLIAHGTLPDQKECERSFAKTEMELKTNFLSAVSLLHLLANYFESKREGTLAVITSVAGDRGRPSNYTYGTAKGALSLYTQGLRARLAKSNVAMVTIKPGFVETPMTAQLKKGPLMASSKTAGEIIYKAVLQKKDVVYLPWFWCGIMAVIKSIPEKIFKKLNL